MQTVWPRRVIGCRCWWWECDMRKREKLRRHFQMVLAAGVSGVGGAGMALLGPTGAVVLGGLVILAFVGFAGAVVFSDREEPSRRLLELIRAVWRGR